MIIKIFSVIALTSLLSLLTTLPVSALSRSTPIQLTVPDTTLTITGYAAPGALVTFIENGSTIGTTTANAAGFYTKALPSQPILRTIDHYFTDAEGVVSRMITSSVSVASQQNTTVESYISPTITRKSAQTLQKGSIVQISGYTASNATVTLSISSQGVVQTTIADSSGFYEFLYNSSSLDTGDYTASVFGSINSPQQDSQSSDEISFTIVDVDGPTRPDFVVSPDQLPPPVVVSPEDGSTINGNRVEIFGESVPNAQINIYENGKLYGSVFANSAGKWTFVYNAGSNKAMFHFEACLEGRCSVTSKSLTLFFEQLNLSCSTIFELAEYRYWGTMSGDEFNIDVLETSGGGTLYIDWGDSSQEERFSHDATRPQAYRKIYQKSGDYNGSARFVQGDCEVIKYFSVRVRDSDTSSIPWSILTLLVVIILFATNRYYRARRENNTAVLKDK